jgi:hypothetical protein
MEPLAPDLGNVADWKHWLREANDELKRVSEELDRTAIAARKAGCTWTEMSRALDISPQAVQQRYGRL